MLSNGVLEESQDEVRLTWIWVNVVNPLAPTAYCRSARVIPDGVMKYSKKKFPAEKSNAVAGLEGVRVQVIAGVGENPNPPALRWGLLPPEFVVSPATNVVKFPLGVMSLAMIPAAVVVAVKSAAKSYSARVAAERGRHIKIPESKRGGFMAGVFVDYRVANQMFGRSASPLGACRVGGGTVSKDGRRGGC
jgi:hypothetical protein